MAVGGHLGKLQTAISQRRIIRFTVCMYTDHTLPSAMMEIRNLFHKGESLADLRYKEKERKSRSWEIVDVTTREEYTLDWSQSKVFLVLSCFCNILSVRCFLLDVFSSHVTRLWCVLSMLRCCPLGLCPSFLDILVLLLSLSLLSALMLLYWRQEGHLDWRKTTKN